MLWALVFTCAGLAATDRPLSLPETVQVIWTFEPQQRGAIISSPFVAEDRIYVGAIRDTGFTSSGAVYCLERRTGKELWQFDNGGKMLHMYSSPCLADGRLYIGEGMHANLVCKLYCLDAATGNELWHFETAGHIESSPCAAQGKVFFGAGDDGVYCLDAQRGVKQWHFHGPFHVDTSPTVIGRRLYVGSGVSRLHKTPAACCLDVENGAVLWRLPTDLPIWGSPAVAGNQVFFGLGNGRLIESAQPPESPAGALLCLNAQTGDVCWRYDVADAVHAKPAVEKQHVYFGARDGGCYCLECGDGRLRWRSDLGSPIVTTPALIDGHLYTIGSAGRVTCLDAETGKTIWALDLAQSTQTKPRLFSSPVATAAEAAKSGHYRLYFGSELRSPVSSAAVLYCLED
jgi:outer membrane protein assembly factor BamB